MKKILFIALLLTSFVTGFSQMRIGYTKSEILYSEFTDKHPNTNHLNDGTYYIEWKDDKTYCMYMFDANGICNWCAIKPFDSNTLNSYIELFNNNCVIINSRKWNLYIMDSRKILNIELISKNDLTTFVITAK